MTSFRFVRQSDGTARWLLHLDNYMASFIAETQVRRYDWGEEQVSIQLFDLFHNDPSPHFHTVSFTHDTYYISFLKSLLQKSVRRSQVNVALSAATELCRVSPVQLLRRLPIIFIEDAVLDVSISGLVWLMLAVENGYSITMKDFDWLMQIVRMIASHPFQDPVSLSSQNVNLKTTTFDLGQFPHTYDTHDTHDTQSQIIESSIVSIALRARRGGMKGDIVMLKKSAQIWMQRKLSMQSDQWISFLHTPHKIELCSAIPITTLMDTHKDLMIVANDFHCSPMVATQISQQTGHSVKDVKQAIWHGNSGINVKKLIPFLTLDVAIAPNGESLQLWMWTEIKHIYYEKSEQILKNLLSDISVS